MMTSGSSDAGLGARIKRYRVEKHMNQAELAKVAGLSAAYVSELESGAGRRPSGRVLLGLGEALGVTIADLLGREIRPRERAELSPGLREFARERGLPNADVEMLAGIRFRGDPPRTVRRWAMIYDTIRTSAGLDDDAP
jgi:transcriptional regulator with XRE-family HTH domain